MEINSNVTEKDSSRTISTQTSQDMTGIPPGINSKVPKRSRGPSPKKKLVRIVAKSFQVIILSDGIVILDHVGEYQNEILYNSI